MIALDTNLLIYDFDPVAPEHAAARRAIAAAQEGNDGWGLPLGVAVEFFSVATRHGNGKFLAQAAEARNYLEVLVANGARVWHPLMGFTSRLFAAAEAGGAVGRRIFDLQIALTAVENGATELWTHDRGFRTVPGLRVVDPLA